MGIKPIVNTTLTVACNYFQMFFFFGLFGIHEPDHGWFKISYVNLIWTLESVRNSVFVLQD